MFCNSTQMLFHMIIICEQNILQKYFIKHIWKPKQISKYIEENVYFTEWVSQSEQGQCVLRCAASYFVPISCCETKHNYKFPWSYYNFVSQTYKLSPSRLGRFIINYIGPTELHLATAIHRLYIISVISTPHLLHI